MDRRMREIKREATRVMSDNGIDDYSISQGGKHIRCEFRYGDKMRLVVLSTSPRTDYGADRLRREVRNIIKRG